MDSDNENEDRNSFQNSENDMFLEEIKCCDDDQDIQAFADALDFNFNEDVIQQMKMVKEQLFRVIKLLHRQLKGEENIQMYQNDETQLQNLKLRQLNKKLEKDLDIILSESANLHLEMSVLRGKNQILIKDRTDMTIYLAQQITKVSEQDQLAIIRLAHFEQLANLYQGDLNIIYRLSMDQILETEKTLINTLNLLSTQKNNLFNEQQKQKLESKSCVICLTKSYTILLEPCGHICVCEDCVKKITKCPIDRVEITKIKKVFLS